MRHITFSSSIKDQPLFGVVFVASVSHMSLVRPRVGKVCDGAMKIVDPVPVKAMIFAPKRAGGIAMDQPFSSWQ